MRVSPRSGRAAGSPDRASPDSARICPRQPPLTPGVLLGEPRTAMTDHCAPVRRATILCTYNRQNTRVPAPPDPLGRAPRRACGCSELAQHSAAFRRPWRPPRAAPPACVRPTPGSSCARGTSDARAQGSSRWLGSAPDGALKPVRGSPAPAGRRGGLTRPTKQGRRLTGSIRPGITLSLCGTGQS